MVGAVGAVGALADSDLVVDAASGSLPLILLVSAASASGLAASALSSAMISEQ